MPWARSFCPLPFRYAPVTVGSGRVGLTCETCLSKSQRKLSDLPGNLCKSLAGVLFHLVACTIEGFAVDLGPLLLDDKPSVALAAMSLGESQP